MKKISIVAAAIIVLVLLAVFARTSGDKDLIGEGIALYRTSYLGELTEQGFVFLPFTRSSDRYGYANVALDINGDGVFSGYDTQSGRQEEWLVRNMFPEIVEGEANRFVLRIVDVDFGAKAVSGIAVLSEEKLSGSDWPVQEAAKAPVVKVFRVEEVIIENRSARRAPDPSGQMATGMPLPGSMGVVPTAHAAGTPAPAHYGARHNDVPDQDQLWNECAPTAISNSLRWLAKRHNMEDRMPQGDPNDLIDELKGDLEWDDGVAHANMIAGKRSFMERHHLPFEAHQIGGRDDSDIIRKIYDEMQKGQAIEVWLSFFDGDGRPAGAHLVTVVGAGVNHGQPYITFHDPDTSSAAGRSRDVYNVEGGNFLPEYWPGNQAYIMYAYAQSPLESFTGGTWTDPRSGDALVTGQGGSLTPPGSDITLNRSQFGFFSVAVNHPGDHRVGETFTVLAGAHYTGKTRTVHYRNAAGESASWTHGAGKPWTLEGSFEGVGSVSPATITDAPPLTSVPGDRFTIEKQFTCTSPGFATVAFRAKLTWPKTGGDVPAEVQRLHHGAEFASTSDELRVDSPPFRCIGVPTPTPTPSSRTAAQPFCPGIEEVADGQDVEVLKAGNVCYPKLQFHVAQPDQCKKTHWHANQGSAVSLSGTTWVDPSGCGLGNVDDVPQGTVRLSLDEAGKFLGGAVFGR
ncbi:MAG: hypothetical protein Q8Q39_00220 [bacterium]|nr:hypothetical protein [bacterium]